jgi:hypothetical protein
MIRKKLFFIVLFIILTSIYKVPVLASGPDTLAVPEKDSVLHSGRLAAVLSVQGALEDCILPGTRIIHSHPFIFSMIIMNGWLWINSAMPQQPIISA